MRIPVKSVIEYATGISIILGAWLYVDAHFASASDVSRITNSLELSQIQLRIDVLEDRIDRESEKNNADQRKIDKMKAQIRRLETRQGALLKR